ncbi:MAG: phosphatidylserine/phosphatidylglycerophosphate/cardiolipin synthase family protein [Candidatus Magasanikbacteria bacterium]|nr:phosphatidylserine/phosphatidylglycerophosphate/cardiolipin synthase family protein [Candidatus Magasanikbacteria bacterium]
MYTKSSYNIYDTTHQAWTAMYGAMQKAQHSIYWEVYIFVEDDAGNKFLNLLKQKAEEGVDVKLIVDYWGSFWLSRKKIDELKKSGIDILFFSNKNNIIRGLRKWFMMRNHRKILIIDENIGFIGGVNVDKKMEDWNDIHMMLKGKVVHSLLRSFAKAYMFSGGNKSNVCHLLKYTYRVEHSSIKFVYEKSGLTRSNTRQRYVEALYKARERVILFSPYYFPDKKLLKAMWAARKRGVKIDLLIPFRSDLVIAKYVAYAWFALMHQKGVKIHMFKKMMHGKGIVVDDNYAMVGSSNLDYTSFYHSEEANVQISDAVMVKKLKRVLDRWILSSRKFDELRWKKRGWVHKSKEWLATGLYKFWFGIK